VGVYATVATKSVHYHNIIGAALLITCYFARITVRNLYKRAFGNLFPFFPIPRYHHNRNYYKCGEAVNSNRESQFLIKSIDLFYTLWYNLHIFLEYFMKRNSLVLAVFFMALSVSMVLTNCDKDGGTTTYTVTFDSNGGSSVAGIGGISSGATITLPTNPTKGTDTFIGWFTDNGTFLNEFTASTAVIADITIFAKWINSNNPLIGTTYSGSWPMNGNDPDTEAPFSETITVTIVFAYATNCNFTLTGGEHLMGGGGSAPNAPYTVTGNNLSVNLESFAEGAGSLTGIVNGNQIISLDMPAMDGLPGDGPFILIKE
jgi:uncharacterized repeat protein (TIGR02543 family)